MKKIKNTENIDVLLKLIIEGIHRKKGNNTISLQLSALDNTITDYFVICDAESGTQVSAISDSVVEIISEQLSVRPLHVEGMQNAQWVLLDFGVIIVHVFQKTYRDFYKLENLWADAPLKNHLDEQV